MCGGPITLKEQEKPQQAYGEWCDIQGEKTEYKTFMRIDKIGTYLALID